MNARMIVSLGIALVMVRFAGAPTHAGVAGKAAQETAEYVLKKFGKSAVREGAESLAERIAKSAVRYGDEVFDAVRKVGPTAMTLADEAGEQAPRMLRLLSKHGDDAAVWVARRPVGMKLLSQYGDEAAEVLIKHKALAEPVIESIGRPAVEALQAVGPRGGRRLAMMTKGGELAELGRTPEVMSVIAQFGDPAMDFIWRNKGPLAVGTTLTAFLANPEPFLDGSTKLVGTVAENVAKPVVQETARAVSGLLWTLLLLLLGIPAGGIYFSVKHPHAAADIAKALLGRAGKARQS